VLLQVKGSELNSRRPKVATSLRSLERLPLLP
jgi:hypothetical protein